MDGTEFPKQRRMHGDEAHNGEALPLYELPIELDGAAVPNQVQSTVSLDQLKPRDRRSFFFLTTLYFLQGTPVGLAFGSIPFLLKERLSYAQVGVFTLASYPFSLKLLWSPIVDAFYSPRHGRRRSWIVPVQVFTSILLLYLSSVVGPLLDHAETKLWTLTILFTVLVFGCATQDIAVDGWALTLLSKPALPYASTAQTIGINSGYFTSFTVFLALSSPEFANKYFRSKPEDVGLVTLPGYLFFCAILHIVVTAYVAFCTTEDGEIDEFEIATLNQQGAWAATKRIYRVMFSVIRLPAMRQLISVHLVAKIAFQAAEAATNLKLLERGLSKEDLALVVLIDFPFEIVFGYYGAKWSTSHAPLQPWMWAYLGRLVCAVVAMTQVAMYPAGGTTFLYLCYVILVHVAGSFMSTIQFVSVSAFHTRIADAQIGGTYMTVLNTICNFGGQWPRLLVLAGVDYFSKAQCSLDGSSCVAADAKRVCERHGGICKLERDGYYVMNVICIGLGILLFYGYIKRNLEKLQYLPTSAWRADHN